LGDWGELSLSSIFAANRHSYRCVLVRGDSFLVDAKAFKIRWWNREKARKKFGWDSFSEFALPCVEKATTRVFNTRFRVSNANELSSSETAPNRVSTCTKQCGCYIEQLVSLEDFIEPGSLA